VQHHRQVSANRMHRKLIRLAETRLWCSHLAN